MGLTLEEFNGMELLWDNLTNKPDEDHAILTGDDLEMMWQLGIVDTKQFPLPEWRSAFDGHKQPDGTYLVSREEFLDKERYRYKGEIMIPFNAAEINEGKYTDEGLQELFDLSVSPSCSLPPDALQGFLDDLKERYRGGDDLIKIAMPAKFEIKKLIDENPSPLRRLELLFDYLLKQSDLAPPVSQTAEAPEKGAFKYEVSPEQLAKLQASSFSIMPLTDTEKKWKILHSIEKSLPRPEPAPKGRSSTTIKKVKRSRKGIRG